MSLDFAMISRMIVDGLMPPAIPEKAKIKSEEGFITDPRDPSGLTTLTRGADQHVGPTERFILHALTWIISIMISVLAFWMSWSCNTALGYNLALKALFGAGAFFFGLIYIFLYLIMRWDVCAPLTLKTRKR